MLKPTVVMFATAGKTILLGAFPVFVTKKSKLTTSPRETLPPLTSIIPAGTFVIPATSATVTVTVLEVALIGMRGLFGST